MHSDFSSVVEQLTERIIEEISSTNTDIDFYVCSREFDVQDHEDADYFFDLVYQGKSWSGNWGTFVGCCLKIVNQWNESDAVSAQCIVITEIVDDTTMRLKPAACEHSLHLKTPYEGFLFCLKIL